MLRNATLAAAAAALVTLLTPAVAPAWGVAHVGYTHVGPYGAYHAGRTVAAGPYGAYGMGTRYGGVSGGYPASYRYGTVGSYYGYHPYGVGYAGAYRYPSDGAYGAGVYRRW